MFLHEGEQRVNQRYGQENTWKSLFDQDSTTYERQYEEHPFWILYNDITWNNIRKYLPQDTAHPILDVGGGTGFWSRKLAGLGYRVICADISYGMLHEGRKKVEGTPIASQIDFILADITDMKTFPDELFSFVLAEGDPLSYCGNPERAVQEMARVAKRDAHIIASVDSFFGALLRMFKANDFQDLDMLLTTGSTIYQGKEKRLIQHNFTVEELMNLYLQNGLEVVGVIGKPTLTMAIAWEEMERVLRSKEVSDKILQLELQFNNNSNIVGLGNHLEIVGRKR